MDEEQRGQGALAWLYQRVRLSISQGSFLDSCPSLTPKTNQRHRYEKITDYNFGSLIRRRDEGVQRDEYDLWSVFDIASTFECMLMMYSICNYANTGKILSIIRSRPGDGESYT